VAGVVEFTDPRLTAIYDEVNPPGPDTAFYVGLADELDARTIVDLGCGTGLLISRLDRPSRRCVGVDPAPEMLAVARGRELSGDVSWVVGGAEMLGAWGADLVVMTGHVAQIIVDESAWRSALSAVHQVLRPGGVVAFESRNPSADSWRQWTPETSRRVVSLAAGGALEVWYDVVAQAGDRVTHEVHYRWAGDGPELVSTLELRYRTQAQLVGALDQAGFEVVDVFGDWDRSAVSRTSPELVVIARRPSVG
jgi:SAM-dependent methyltransferase